MISWLAFKVLIISYEKYVERIKWILFQFRTKKNLEPAPAASLVASRSWWGGLRFFGWPSRRTWRERTYSNWPGPTEGWGIHPREFWIWKWISKKKNYWEEWSENFGFDVSFVLNQSFSSKCNRKPNTEISNILLGKLS